ncbi:MAG: TlyA family RNA methyltransferase [Actinobacteria bacterium]|nr:TlyA family RNA methyltransferase [Actinomycetota bacterium]
MTNLKEALIKRNLASGPKDAEALIISGNVKVNEKTIDKPGQIIKADAKITVQKSMQYVSRGGLKIEGAFRDFKISAAGKKIIDVGASTGGFTDYLLQAGASAVTAIDVGYGILAWKLRNNPAVKVMERTNIRNLDKEMIPYIADIVVSDVSFISIKKIFEKIYQFTKDSGKILLLVKPQFEAERNDVGKKGIIKDTDIHRKVLKSVLGFVLDFECGFKGLAFSRIRGAKGNVEYWIYVKKIKNKITKTSPDIKNSCDNYDKIIDNTVKEAQNFFKLKKTGTDK